MVESGTGNRSLPVLAKSIGVPHWQTLLASGTQIG
jgi:hypothetical protein